MYLKRSLWRLADRSTSTVTHCGGKPFAWDAKLKNAKNFSNLTNVRSLALNPGLMAEPSKSSHQRTLSKDELLEEWEIIQAAQKDAAAFRPLYERYYLPIFRFIYRRTESEAIAADVCAQVFFSALKKIERYQYKGVPFSAWLYRIASNEVVQYFRDQKKVRTVSLEPHHLGDLIDEEYKGGNEALISGMIAALNELPEQDMQLIELRFFEQRPFKEIAEIMEITENNAKVKTYRILEKLRKRIK